MLYRMPAKTENLFFTEAHLRQAKDGLYAEDGKVIPILPKLLEIFNKNSIIMLMEKQY